MAQKYGVISIADFCADLRDWSSLYVAGRFHKPVRLLEQDDLAYPLVSQAIEANRHAAFRVAVLLLPQQFTKAELYRKIVGLSYEGDYRMRFAEHPRKIENIAAGQYDLLDEAYSKYLAGNAAGLHVCQDGSISKTDCYSQPGYAKFIPPSIAAKMPGRYQQLAAELQAAIRKTVFAASVRQSAKGLLTINPWQGACYAAAKMLKRLRR